MLRACEIISVIVISPTSGCHSYGTGREAPHVDSTVAGGLGQLGGEAVFRARCEDCRSTGDVSPKSADRVGGVFYDWFVHAETPFAVGSQRALQCLGYENLSYARRVSDTTSSTGSPSREPRPGVHHRPTLLNGGSSAVSRLNVAPELVARAASAGRGGSWWHRRPNRETNS